MASNFKNGTADEYRIELQDEIVLALYEYKSPELGAVKNMSVLD